MTRFSKIYEAHKQNKEIKKQKLQEINVEGYGYIKRRIGLLSNEVKSPTFSPVQK